MGSFHRKKGTVIKLLALCMAGLLLATAAGCGGKQQTAGEQPQEPAKKIRWATIAGFYSDWAAEVAKDFEAKTGIQVEMVPIDFVLLYEKEMMEMVGKTGAYDVITTEHLWKTEWAHAGLIEPLDDYIAQTPKEEFDINDVAPALVDLACKYKGKIYALPYYSYTQGMFYRQDLFEDPIEKEAFKKKYGYDLAPPKTYEQLRDIAEFFTRKKGEKLKGQPLDKDFYGVGMMAGRFPHIQDEWGSIVWAWGGEIIDEQGNVLVNNEIGVKALEFYKSLLKFAPPGALTSAYDEVVAQMQQGMIAMTLGFYLDQWANMVKTEKNIPGAKIACAPAPGYTAYIGAFGLAIPKDSKHKQEAWQFIRFLSSKEAQKKFALGGGTTCLLSVMRDPEVLAHREVAGHYKVHDEILQYHYEHKVRHPFFESPVGGKIWKSEAQIYISEAVTGQKTPKQALDDFAAAIKNLLATVK